MSKIVIIGSAHPFRGGGITTFNHRLTKELLKEGHDCEIYSFSLQYPSFMFPGTSQYTDEPAPENITIHSVINSINPFNWIKTGRRLKKLKPDLIIVRFWLPLMGPAFGTILRIAKKNRHTKIICLADNVIPHEKRAGDKLFTKYFLKPCDAFVVMSEKVKKDLEQFEKKKPVILQPHPLYDNFGEIVSKADARNFLKLPTEEKIILFFGFIRKYKGLDLLLEAMADERIKKADIKLLVAGEFYEDEKAYREQITRLGIEEQLILKTDFIPDSDVKYYLCAADAVVQPYRNATQSGVTPLAYHFEKPMVVTNVGGLPALVSHNEAGLVVEPTAASIASGILEFYKTGEQHFLPFLKEKKKQFSWPVLTKQILDLSNTIPKSE
ncbi:MAG: glycosyltransferase [Chitinophagaceae bacterium]|nr:glycosyltransferase [Chitinophagaceae bacterium]